MKKDSKLFRTLINLDILIASIALVVLVLCTFSGVLARYVVGKPFGWIEEVQAALIIWVVFVAGGAAFRTGNHAAIEIFYELFPKIGKKVLNIMIGIVVVATLGFLCYTSVQYLQLFIQTGRTTPVLHIPYIWIYAIIPVSCILQILNYFIVNVFGYEDEIEKLVDDEEGQNS